MWYSWRGATGNADSEIHSKHESASSLRYAKCFPTLLNSDFSTDNILQPLLPPPDTIGQLWTCYLRNVHPIMMIFFDWQVQKLIDMSQKDSASLSPAHAALVSAIMFVAVHSLTAKDCSDMALGDHKTAFEMFLAQCEAHLRRADFSTTSELSTLQALMLYLVSYHSCLDDLLCLSFNRLRCAIVHTQQPFTRLWERLLASPSVWGSIATDRLSA